MQALKRAIGYAIFGAIVGAVIGVILYHFLHFVLVFLGLSTSTLGGSPRTIAFGMSIFFALSFLIQSFDDD